MKAKVLLKMLILVMAFSVSCFKATAVTITDGDDGQILISPFPTNPNGAPRGPVLIPFLAYHNNDYVTLESSDSCGLVNVVLVSTAGDYYSTIFDMVDGSIQIPISGNAGDYTMLLTVLSGEQFIGEFSL